MVYIECDNPADLVAFLVDPVARAKAIRAQEDRRVMEKFRDREHARQVWDSEDDADIEDAHRYLNLIGDGEYCAI